MKSLSDLFLSNLMAEVGPDLECRQKTNLKQTCLFEELFIKNVFWKLTFFLEIDFRAVETSENAKRINNDNNNYSTSPMV